MTQTLAVVGLGAMGLPIARHLATTGVELLTYDAQPAARTRAAAQGLDVVDDLSAVATHASAVVLSLPTPSVVREVVGALWRDTPHLLVLDTSTVDPGTAAELAARGPYADTPVLGRPGSVGSWTIPVGCEPQHEQRVLDLLAPLARRVVRVGAPGSAATLKVCNNLMLSAINAATAEALVLAEAAGLDPAVFVETVVDSGAASVSGLFRDAAPRAVSGDLAPVFQAALMRKDAQLALDLAQASGVVLPVLAASQQLNEATVSAGWGELDSIAVVRALRELARP